MVNPPGTDKPNCQEGRPACAAEGELCSREAVKEAIRLPEIVRITWKRPTGVRWLSHTNPRARNSLMHPHAGFRERPRIDSGVRIYGYYAAYMPLFRSRNHAGLSQVGTLRADRQTQARETPLTNGKSQVSDAALPRNHPIPGNNRRFELLRYDLGILPSKHFNPSQ